MAVVYRASNSHFFRSNIERLEAHSWDDIAAMLDLKREELSQECPHWLPRSLTAVQYSSKKQKDIDIPMETYRSKRQFMIICKIHDDKLIDFNGLEQKVIEYLPTGHAFSEGFYTRTFVESLNVPFFTRTKQYGPKLAASPVVLLPPSRCKELNVPVQLDEMPIAFKYVNKGPGTYRYSPLYDRSELGLDCQGLKEYEIFNTTET